MDFFHNIVSNFQPLLNFVSAKSQVHINKQKYNPAPLKQQLCFDDKAHVDDDIKLSKGEIDMVMGRLGLSLTTDHYGSDEERFGSKEILQVFEEKEASLEEVKEAFNVFDENQDGFIDAKDLQRVLCCLGFTEELELDKCREMIMAVDQNEDGFIDFDEFVKFMEQLFY